MSRPPRPPVPPLDPPMVPLALGGTGLWLVAGLVLLAADAPALWLWTCLAGVLIGGAMSATMLLRQRWRRARAGLSQPAHPGQPPRRP